jgi:hypothetical protein
MRSELHFVTCIFIRALKNGFIYLFARINRYCHAKLVNLMSENITAVF